MTTLRQRLLAAAKVFAEHAQGANEAQSHYSHYPHADVGAKSEKIGEERAYTDAARVVLDIATDAEPEADDVNSTAADLVFVDGTLDALGAPRFTRADESNSADAESVALTRSQRIRALLSQSDALRQNELEELVKVERKLDALCAPHSRLLDGTFPETEHLTLSERLEALVQDYNGPDYGLIAARLDELGAPTHDGGDASEDTEAPEPAPLSLYGRFEAFLKQDVEADNDVSIDVTLDELGAPQTKGETRGVWTDEEVSMTLSRSGRIVALVNELREALDQQKEDHAATVADLQRQLAPKAKKQARVGLEENHPRGLKDGDD